MSSTQTIAAGLIGLVVAGAGAVGIYNYTTSGCFLGSCSSGGETSETNNVGLLVSETAATSEGDSCCPLTEAKDSEIVLAAGSVEAGAAETCEKACEGMSKAECEKACDEGMKMTEAKDGCCGGIAKAEDTAPTDAPIVSDD